MTSVGLSATVAEPAELCRYLVPQPPKAARQADLDRGEGGAAPIVTMLDTDADMCRGPGHSARHAFQRDL